MAANNSSLRVVTKKDYTNVDVVGKHIPLSFGANFNDDPFTRTNLRKSHTLGAAGVQSTVPLASAVDPLGTVTSHTNYNSPLAQSYQWQTTTSQLHPPPFGAATLEASAAATKNAPVVPDPCKFLGYIRESVPESQEEKFRVRKVGVFYFADGTLCIREAPSINSGLDQSVLLSRQVVPRDMSNPDAGVISLDDIATGKWLTAFAFRVFIYDMDAVTRRYYADVLRRDASDFTALPFPDSEDTHGNKVRAALARSGRRMLPTTDYDYKRALESMSGSGAITKHAPSDVRSAQQFLRNSINDHLTFLAYWDDRAHMSGDLRRVVIRYYLENDAVEIVEDRGDNAGREGGPKLLCRQRVPVPGAVLPSSHVGGEIQQNTYGLLYKEQHVTDGDFLPMGKTLRLYQHDYVIYDADAFTRRWYERERGVAVGPAVDVSAVLNRDVKPLPVQYPPPHTGYGTDEDSVQSWKHLVMKAPKIDTEKIQREEGKAMVFRAVFAPSTIHAPQDEGREFVIRFHRATDELEVFERQLRNTGIVGGKFLARGRHLKPLRDGRKVPFTPQDFVVGQEVTIVGHTYRLLEIDELSRKQCAGIVPPLTESRIRALIVNLKDLLNAKYCHLNEAFRAIAPDGALTIRQLRDFFVNCSGPISEEEATAIIYHFSTGGASVNYSQFLNMMAYRNASSIDETSNNPRAVKLIGLPQAGSEEHARAVQQMRLSDEAAHHNVLRKLLIGKLEVRRAYLQEVFRLLSSAAPNARLTAAAFRANLKDQLQINVSEADRDVLVSMLFPTPEAASHGITFGQFYEFADPTIRN